ncbi:hypothetical protein H4F99_10300 [Lysobacter sp. SG-8]|uniref:Uncharacterized protein n=1 Tax=Marilutibacter penaei TaxID=2759900 RepID=A0A7W3U4T6_9GAMM|nr:hypothetical protein [Lysobacter penaei]MBB1088882.1 hypothetical protein [Lysobacter penaei]
MDKRTLLGCIAALALLLAFELMVRLSGHALDLPLRTPLGELPVAGLFITCAAMALGGWIAREGFRVPAIVLAVVIAVATTASLQLSGALSPDGPPFALGDILRYGGLAMLAQVLMAWLGAVLGERLATRRTGPLEAR